MWRTIAIGMAVAIGLAVASVWIVNERFDERIEQEIEALLEQSSSQQRIVVQENLNELPEPVQYWLSAAGIVGQPIPRTIRLRQEGEIRLGPDQPWMPFHADQYYTIDPPAFIWRVSASAVPGLFIRGVDLFRDGRGSMQMKPLALSTVVDASGPKLDQGSALRYLQETVWFPFAALSDAISWEAIDDRSARATLTLDTITVSGMFFFDKAGQIIDFHALRFRDEDALQPWNTPMHEHGEYNGVVVPTEGEGIWGSGDDSFTYIRLRLVNLDYDVAEVYR